MEITKEISYKYLKHRGTMCKYSSDFNIVNIYTESAREGVNEHPVIRCEYKRGDGSLGYKNVHIDLSKFMHWVKLNRQDILNELLK